MGAQRASWQAAFAAEMAWLSKQEHLQALLDLVKAFETIPHDLVAKAAMEKGYNLVILRLSFAAYRLQRAVGIDGVFFTKDPGSARHHCWIGICDVGAGRTPARSNGTRPAEVVSIISQLEIVR